MIEGLVNGPYGLNDQFRELLCFHPIVDLCAKSLLEVGGVLPTDILFDCLNVANDIMISTLILPIILAHTMDIYALKI